MQRDRKLAGEVNDLAQEVWMGLLGLRRPKKVRKAARKLMPKAMQLAQNVQAEQKSWSEEQGLLWAKCMMVMATQVAHAVVRGAGLDPAQAMAPSVQAAQQGAAPWDVVTKLPGGELPIHIGGAVLLAMQQVGLFDDKELTDALCAPTAGAMRVGDENPELTEMEAVSLYAATDGVRESREAGQVVARKMKDAGLAPLALV